MKNKSKKKKRVSLAEEELTNMLDERQMDAFNAYQRATFEPDVYEISYDELYLLVQARREAVERRVYSGEITPEAWADVQALLTLMGDIGCMLVAFIDELQGGDADDR